MRQIKAKASYTLTLSPMSDRAILAYRAVPSADAIFLSDVRHFLSTALTPELREAGRNTIGVHSDIDACRVWHFLRSIRLGTTNLSFIPKNAT